MKELENCREKINEIDTQIAKLFCERMEESKKVALYKKEHGLKITDEEREQFLIDRNSSLIEDDKMRSYYVSFLKNMMDVSKQYQYRLIKGMRVAVSGVKGAFAHSAAKSIFPQGNFIFYNDFITAYKSVENGECDCCVLPIENNYAGEVLEVTDLIFSGSLYINGIYEKEICHNLLGLPNSNIDDIKTVISHPQALSQCEGYIRNHKFKQIKETNTAIAAQKVSLNNDKSVGAIASSDTAELYGLKILERRINEASGNTTRFAVFSRIENKSESSDSTFIMLFTVQNEAGALARAINIIGKYGFNMRVLRSRPIKDSSWQYYFYVEAEGNAYDKNAENMIKELSTQCDKVKIAGSFLKEYELD